MWLEERYSIMSSHLPLEISSTTGEYALPSGRVRRDISVKFDNQRFSYEDASGAGRRMLGCNAKVFSQEYAVDVFRIEGDIIIFSLSREAEEVKRQRELEAKRRQDELEKEVFQGLETLLSEDPALF